MKLPNEAQTIKRKVVMFTKQNLKMLYDACSMYWECENKLLISRNPQEESRIDADLAIEELWISSFATPRLDHARVALSSALLVTTRVLMFKLTIWSTRKYFWTLFVSLRTLVVGSLASSHIQFPDAFSWKVLPSYSSSSSPYMPHSLAKYTALWQLETSLGLIPCI